jgi:hypothetical protein
LHFTSCSRSSKLDAKRKDNTQTHNDGIIHEVVDSISFEVEFGIWWKEETALIGVKANRRLGRPSRTNQSETHKERRGIVLPHATGVSLRDALSLLPLVIIIA